MLIFKKRELESNRDLLNRFLYAKLEVPNQKKKPVPQQEPLKRLEPEPKQES